MRPRVPFALILLLLFPAGCEEDEGDIALDDDSAAADDDDDDSGGLPDYSDSPCWGTAETTSMFDHDSAGYVDVATTCRAEGERVMVFVADQLWESFIDQELVNRFVHHVELYSEPDAYDPELGLLQNVEAVFGPLQTDSMPSGKMHIFVLDTEGIDDAYVCPATAERCAYACVHLDGVMMEPIDGDDALAVTAREAFHLLHGFSDEDEELWVDESLAQAAITINGFYLEEGWVNAFLANPDYNWGPGDPEGNVAHYGAFTLWGSYLWERGGVDLMRAITAEPANGWESLDQALATAGLQGDTWALFLDWIVAVYMDAVDGEHGMQSFSLGAVTDAGTFPGAGTLAGSVSPYGIDYLSLPEGTWTVTPSDLGGGPLTTLAITYATDLSVEDVSSGGSVTVEAGATAFLAVTAPSATQYEIALQ